MVYGNILVDGQSGFDGLAGRACVADLAYAADVTTVVQMILLMQLTNPDR